VVGVAGFLVLLVCADRLLLGRHYPTDLVGGILLGGTVALLGAALLPVRRVDEVVQRAQDDERDAIHVDDAPPVERELVLSRSA
jgi:membrane-associated phospholipid phosphatase